MPSRNWVSTIVAKRNQSYPLCIHVLPALKMDICIHLSTFLTPIMCLTLSSQRWATGSFYLKIAYYLGSMCICLFDIGESKKVFTSKGKSFLKIMKASVYLPYTELAAFRKWDTIQSTVDSFQSLILNLRLDWKGFSHKRDGGVKRKTNIWNFEKVKSKSRHRAEIWGENGDPHRLCMTSLPSHEVLSKVRWCKKYQLPSIGNLKTHQVKCSQSKKKYLHRIKFYNIYKWTTTKKTKWEKEKKRPINQTF